MKFLRWLIVLALAQFSESARAYVSPPSLFPEHPNQNDQVEIRLAAGYCDAFEGAVDSALVNANGNAVEVMIDSISFTDSNCVFPKAIAYRFTIGTYSPGSYTVTVKRRYTDFGTIETVETLGVLVLKIEGAATEVAAVPAVTPSMLAVLIFGVAFCACWFGRK